MASTSVVYGSKQFRLLGIKGLSAALSLAGVVCAGLSGCSSSSSSASSGTTTLPSSYTLTINSTDPVSGVTIAQIDSGTTVTSANVSPYAATFAAGTTVKLTAPGTAVNGTGTLGDAVEVFAGWTGCTQSVGTTCVLQVYSDATVTATYKSQYTMRIQGIPTTVSPGVPSAGINVYVGNAPSTPATAGDCSVVLTGPPGYTGPLGTLTPSAGTLEDSTCGNSAFVYSAPFPVFPPTVTFTSTLLADPNLTATQVITIAPVAAHAFGTAAAPGLTLLPTATTFPISPLVYGVNQFASGTALQAAVPVTIDRWGGDAATRYSYLFDIYNSASDYYFEQYPSSGTAYPDTSRVNTQIAQDKQYNAVSMITVPMIGFTPKNIQACSFSVTKYGSIFASGGPKNVAADGDCGSGNNNGTNFYGYRYIGNDPADTSTPIDQTYATNWVNYLTTKFGTAAAGGVQIYQLDNEPNLYFDVHWDTRGPTAKASQPEFGTGFTTYSNNLFPGYDELVGKGILYATAIKKADPTAAVAGPVVSGFDSQFFSAVDTWNGYTKSPYCDNDNLVDYDAHGSVPFLDYYLQQMATASTTAGARLLDYVDIHAYDTPNGVGLSPTGDSVIQSQRVQSVRFLYDYSYLDPQFQNPYVIRGPPTTCGGEAHTIPVQEIPYLEAKVAANYPGTKTSISEYNFGGLETVNGAIAQAEAMAIMGWQGLDIATVWAPPDPVAQAPGVQAFNLFLNYDGNGSKFGDQALALPAAVPVDAMGNPLLPPAYSDNSVPDPPYYPVRGAGVQSQDPTTLSAYAAKRTSDGALTILVFNKSFGDLTSNLALTTTAATASVYQLSYASPNSIAKQPDAKVANGAVTLTYPAQSATLLVFAQ